jgi:hypothetical protein
MPLLLATTSPISIGALAVAANRPDRSSLTASYDHETGDGIKEPEQMTKTAEKTKSMKTTGASRALQVPATGS